MSRVANYLIAQHLSDPFRREPRNVGVIVRVDKDIRAKFFGESEPSVIDARKTRVLPYPAVYAQWVKYWRRIIAQRPDEAWEQIQNTAKDHYQIINGGEVDSIGTDHTDDVANYLYAALVSEGGIASALGAPDETEAAIRLSDAVEGELKKMQLLDVGKDLYTEVKHPVRRGIPVQGATTAHNVTFFQRNGHDVVMEPIDLAVKRDKKRMEERAGWASRVFDDIKEKSPTTEAIAIVSATAEEERDESASYALRLLEPFAQIVNWQSDQDRRKFLEERRKTAAA